MKKNYYSKNTIIITCISFMIKCWLKTFVIVVINLIIHPRQVTFLSPKLRSFWPAPWIKSSGWGQNKKSNKNRLLAFCAALEIWKNIHGSQLPSVIQMGDYQRVFSLNFSSASKGPFMASKAKNMCQRRPFLGGRGQWSEGHCFDLAVKFRS